MTDHQIVEYWKAHIKDKLWVSRLVRIMAEEVPEAHERTLKKFVTLQRKKTDELTGAALDWAVASHAGNHILENRGARRLNHD
jgi:hypothetical protein